MSKTFWENLRVTVEDDMLIILNFHKNHVMYMYIQNGVAKAEIKFVEQS